MCLTFLFLIFLCRQDVVNIYAFTFFIPFFVYLHIFFFKIKKTDEIVEIIWMSEYLQDYFLVIGNFAKLFPVTYFF